MRQLGRTMTLARGGGGGGTMDRFIRTAEYSSTCTKQKAFWLEYVLRSSYDRSSRCCYLLAS